MGEEEHIEEILNLSNGDVTTNCNVLQTAFDSENYEDLFCPFGTPPNKFACIDPLPSGTEENLSRQPAADPLGFPEGSPVTPQLHESSMILYEIDFDDHSHPSPFASRPFHTRQENENDAGLGDLSDEKVCKESPKECKVQLHGGIDRDFQELLELGRAMNLPSRPEVGSAGFLHFDEGTHKRQRETSDNFSLLPFPLEQVISTLEREESATDEQNFPKHSMSLPSSDRTQAYPDSSIIDTNAQTVVNHGIPASKQSETAMPVSIDDMLQQVASRNLRSTKRLERSKETEVDESTSEPALKKRKTTFSSTETQTGVNDNSKLSRSTGQGKRSSKKRTGGDRTGAETSGKGVTSGGSTPSRFCHICTRAAKPDVVLVCGNVARGTCRKVICFKCIRDMSWDWGSLHGTEPWTCTHCREDCPAKAQCHTYKRVNQNRRADGRRSKRTTNAQKTTKTVDLSS